MEPIGIISGAVIGVFTVIRAIVSAFRHWEDKRLDRAMREKEVRAALAELRPNGGASLADKVNANCKKIDSIEKDVKEILDFLKENK